MHWPLAKNLQAVSLILTLAFTLVFCFILSPAPPYFPHSDAFAFYGVEIRGSAADALLCPNADEPYHIFFSSFIHVTSRVNGLIDRFSIHLLMRPSFLNF